MEFQHAMFTRNGVRNLKDIKRGNQSKKADVPEEAGVDDEVGSEVMPPPPAKKPRQDYAAFKTDVSRLQKNLEEFEHDLKEHTMQVQLKLAYILTALDESAALPPAIPQTQQPLRSSR